MKFKSISSIIAAMGLSVCSAGAETTNTPSLGENVFWSLLPFFIIVPVFFIFFRMARRGQNSKIKVYDEYRARNEQHMERVEKSLERIAQLLEKKN
jgi:hypothetical protein